MNAKEIMVTDYVRVDQNDTLSHLIGQLRRNKEKAALVFDGDKYIGLTDRHLLIRAKQNPAEMKVRKILVKVPVLKGDEDISKIAELMYGADCHILPVAENNQVIGVVKSIDLINLIKDNADIANLKASEIMGKKLLIALKEDERLGKALEIMKEQHIERMPIINDKGEVVNVVSMSNIMFNYILQLHGKGESRSIGGNKDKMKAFNKSFDVNSFPIKNMGSLTVIDASPDSIVYDIIELIDENNISSVILTVNHKPIGIVTIRDLLKLLIK